MINFFSIFSNRKKKFYQVGRKLRTLMVLEIALLTLSFFLCVFFFHENKKMQQNNSIFQLNNTLLMYSNSTMENLSTASLFPLLRSRFRYEDKLLTYICEEDHGGISSTDFHLEFQQRISELVVQFQDIYSILLFEPDGTLLDNTKIYYYIYLPYKNYSDGSWYQNTTALNGQLYFLSDEEMEYLGLPRSTPVLYAARVIRDYSTLEPICIVLIGIRASDIPSTFKTQKLFTNQSYGLFDSTGKQISGTETFSLTFEELQQSEPDDYTLKRTESGQTWIYHISYTNEIVETYAVIRTPYSGLLIQRFSLLLPICITGIITITLNIWIFSSIIRSINQPLADLVNMCTEIGKGNFSVRIPCSPKDELSYLTNSLNSMSAHVEQLVEEVYIKNLAKRDLELQMLRSQINPHFLYNTLENMRMSACIQGYQELSQMCLYLSRVLRYGISNPAHLVTVREELEYLNVYTSLLHFCFPKLEVSVIVDEGILDYSIIKVLFQPLVENSVNHASQSISASLTIHIWGYEEENDLIFIVSDDGNGMDREQLEYIRSYLSDEHGNDKGIGLKNIHRRINLYYGSEYGLYIDSISGHGTSVTIRIPKTTEAVQPGGTL